MNTILRSATAVISSIYIWIFFAGCSPEPQTGGPSPQPEPAQPDLPDSKVAFEQAMDHYRRGKLAEARRVMNEAETQIAELVGEDHPEYARVLFQHCSFCLAIEEFENAVEKCRKAAAIEGKDEASRKDQLTYGMNLGEILQFVGRDEEALQVIENNVAARAEFYGEDHSGYSYGLAELASALIRADRADEALAAAEKCVSIDLANQNAHVSMSLLYQGIAACQTGKPNEAFSRWEQLQPEWRHSLVENFEFRIDKFDPNLLIFPLQQLARVVEEHPTSDDQDLLGVLSILSNVAREAEVHPVRISALQEMVQLTREEMNVEDHVYSLKALAIAHGDAGDRKSESTTFETAISFCRDNGMKSALAGCLRESAIAAGRARDPEADSRHQAAVAAARASGDQLELGKSLGARGIFLHHQGKPKEAVPLLEESILLLPDEERYRFFVLNHVEPARKGEACQCSDQGPLTIAAMLKKAMIREVGSDLVSDVKYSPDDPENPYSIELARELNPDELQKVNDAWTNVYNAIRRQLATQ